MTSKLRISNDYSPERLRIQHEGLTLVFQGNVDHEYVNIMNPNDGRRIRQAQTDASPTLLGSFSTMSNAWSIYKDAVLLPSHPMEADGFSGLYVVDHKAPAFETRREGNITHIQPLPPKDNASRSETAGHISVDHGGAQIIPLFGGPQAD